MKKHPYDAGEAPVGAANISVELAHGIHNGWVVGAISALVLLVGAVAGAVYFRRHLVHRRLFD